MTAETDFIEDLIEIRAKLKRQLGLIESGQIVGTGDKFLAGAADVTKARLKKWIHEIDVLLKENASVRGV